MTRIGRMSADRTRTGGIRGLTALVPSSCPNGVWARGHGGADRSLPFLSLRSAPIRRIRVIRVLFPPGRRVAELVRFHRARRPVHPQQPLEVVVAADVVAADA